MKELKFLISKNYNFKVADGETILYYRARDGPINLDSESDKEQIKKALNIIRYRKEYVIEVLQLQLPEIQNILSVDIETSGKDPIEGEIRVISCFDGITAKATTNIEELREVLADKTILKIFHNAMFDVHWLNWKEFAVNNFTDTLVMSIIVNNGVSRGNSLKMLALKYLGIEIDKSKQDVSNWQNEVTKEHLKYAQLDAIVTYKIYLILKELIEDKYLEVLLHWDIRILPALVQMKANGIFFDFEGWQEELNKQKVLKEVLALELIDNLNIENLNSNPQVLKGLNFLGYNLSSTESEELKKFPKNSIPQKMGDYRKMTRKLITYGVNLKDKLPPDSRLRGNFKVSGASTGRMTCSSVNLQGMPNDSKFYFKAKEGAKFVGADYPAIEPRILAQLSQDPNLLDLFRSGGEIHERTAALILGLKEGEAVDPKSRKIAKQTNFGISYGMTEFGLHRKLQSVLGEDISPELARDFRNGYFTNYPEVLNLMRRQLKSRKVQTLGGRVWDDLPYGSRQKIKFPIQGSCAHIIKHCIYLLMNSMAPSWKLLNCVHDEVLLEVPTQEVERAKRVLKKAMEEAFYKFVKTVPVQVEPWDRSTWGEEPEKGGKENDGER